MANPSPDRSQEEVNEIMAGMETVYAGWVNNIEDGAPTCHFAKMQFHMGEGESWYECRYCGHTKEA
ncbi:hypothetical protein [Massilia timonae]|uniref:hypothetical protein n=1 Tax=Massilia timonae TaxID=47229 RepID=UPI0028D6E000|nr:hypothetical protein [Massilia timonae]